MSLRFHFLTSVNYRPLNKAVIITYNQEERIAQDDLEIEVVPVWRWLLE